MTWAPWPAASWATFSCFWIIDSLSPVQLACSSAPRTFLGMTLLASVARSESRGPTGEGERVHPGFGRARALREPYDCRRQGRGRAPARGLRSDRLIRATTWTPTEEHRCERHGFGRSALPSPA